MKVRKQKQQQIWRPLLAGVAIALVVVGIVVAISIGLAQRPKPTVEALTQARIQRIRTTKNTDISSRTGQVFYVAPDGDDTSDGLSPETAWCSLGKINQAFNRKIIQDGDTVLLQRGGIYRGSIAIKAYDIWLGAYGDESKSKPELLVSPYNGATSGVWTEEAPHIWHYTVDGQDPFKNDVGVIWGFKNGQAQFAQKIINKKTDDETQIVLSELLTKDLEFYHFGHASRGEITGGALYLYSTINPQTRFDAIEFAIGKNAINFGSYTNLKVDNLTIKYAGNHGIGGGTMANLQVTNCELGYIGGAMQYYKDGVSPVRFGNAIEIYGSVTETNGYPVQDGFVVQNNYIYQVYDAGITFQITTDKSSIIEKVRFADNVVESCNYNVEYWNYCEVADEQLQAKTYINHYSIDHNIMRYAGCGVCTTRPNQGYSCHIKTWAHNQTAYNRVVGEYQITDNIFDSPREQTFYIDASDALSLPQVRSNTFYSSTDVPFGSFYVTSKPTVYPYTRGRLNQYFPHNEFNYLESFDQHYSGVSQDVAWDLNLETETLTIDGTGAMADYSADNLPEWYAYRNFVSEIVIGENVTKLGKYAFYNLPYVAELEINAVALADLTKIAGNPNDGDNYTFYKTGEKWSGMQVTFGEKVTRVPAQIFWPSDYKGAANITSLVFKGNQVTEIGDHAFLKLHTAMLVIPDGVESIGTLAFSSADAKIIYLPASVKKLGGWVFSGCQEAEKIVLSPNITQIGNNTFNNTKNLKQLVIPGDVTFTGNNYQNLFATTSATTVYGNSTVKKMVQDYSQQTGTNNLTYANLADYPNLCQEIYAETQPAAAQPVWPWIVAVVAVVIVIIVLILALVCKKRRRKK